MKARRREDVKQTMIDILKGEAKEPGVLLDTITAAMDALPLDDNVVHIRFSAEFPEKSNEELEKMLRKALEDAGAKLCPGRKRD